MPAAELSTLTSHPAARTPTHIGEYKIVRKIGEGGMGIVYEAAQAEPRRAVALKVIRGGRFVDDNAIKMFRREAQTLARLKHPGIAAIYEAGHTDDGQHFFAMEMVRGETLAAWLKKRAGEQLTTTEVRLRLALFRKICEAVAYAHQRGVIHRDLKPGNILVSHDPQGVTDTSWPDLPAIKILDFGLARITDGDVAVTTVITEIGKLQGTLAYMSPEQIRGNSDEIDLRSDLYSLGVILHEILTGKLPYLILQVPVTEAARIISQQAPTAPSKVWPGPKRPDRDIDTIVLKALEKEPQRRYQSVSSLAGDIERYLTSQPILARPPSTLYQIRKMAARNKTAFTLAAAVLVMLAGFAVTMTVQARRIATERDRANLEAETAKQVSEFLVGLFEVSDPSESRGNTITAREILDRGAGKIERELKGQPLVQASMMDTMGKVYQGLGLYGQAEKLLREAAGTREGQLGDQSVLVASSLADLGWTLWRSGRPSDALVPLERALAIQERLLAPGHFDTAVSHYRIGAILAYGGEHAPARRHLNEALDVFEKVRGPESESVAMCLADQALSFIYAGDPSLAIPLAERALSISRKLFGEDHPNVALCLNNLGQALSAAGQHERALACLERCVAVSERVFGPTHHFLGSALHTLGELRRKMGELDLARPPLERSLAIFEKELEPNHVEVADPLYSLGMIDLAQGDLASAQARLRQALAIREHRLAPDHLSVLETLEGLASLLRKTGRDAEAAPLEARARDIRGQLGKSK